MSQEDTLDSNRGTVLLMQAYTFMGLHRPQRKLYWPLFYLHSAFVNLITILMSPLVFSANIILDYKRMSLGQILNSTQAFINVAGIPIKIGAVALNFGRFYRCAEIIQRLDAHCLRDNAKEMARIKRIEYMGNSLFVRMIGTYFSYGLVNYFVSIIIGQMPYALYNPLFNWRQSRMEYAWHALYEFFFMAYNVFYQAMNDSYVIVYIYIIQMHLKNLVDRVKQLGADPNKSDELNYTELVDCIKYHKDLYELLDTISPLISITMFVQFCCSTSILSVSLVNILLVSKDASRLGSFIYFIVVMFQVAPTCYICTSLVATANELPTAIFHGDWTGQSQKFRKMLIFFIQRAQKKISLTAMQIFIIDLNTFINLAKFSFSLYTLLKGMDFAQK